MSALSPTRTPTQEASRRRRAKFRLAIEQRAAELQAAKAAAEAEQRAVPEERRPPEPATPPLPTSARRGVVFIPELQRAADAPEAAYPSIAYIQLNVAAYFNIKIIDIKSARRSTEVVRPRQVAMWFCKELTPLSLPAIGRHFGGRDHTTVMHSVRKISRAMASDAAFSQDIAKLFELITGTAQ